MTACVFLGPTLPVDQARQILDATYLPPVRQGDVCRAVMRYRPRMIGIVDGYFHQVPSVWHKEILFAMAEGVHVFGSASMGALRAAELDEFGMRGVGDVFEAFRDGQLEDDDEVAVVHAPAEVGFVAASEAMVNIRRTLEAAGDQAIVGAETGRRLTAIAKALFYPQRTYPEMLKRGAAAGLPKGELEALGAWLERGRVDVKRNDACAMLRLMKTKPGEETTPMSVDYAFQHTTMWDAAIGTFSAEPGTHDDGDAFDDLLKDEMRLDRTFERHGETALLQALALDEADRLGLHVDDDERRTAMAAFRLERNLHRGADLRAWLDARGLDRRALDRILEERLLVGKVAECLQASVADLALDQLRLSGDFERLSAKAGAKRRLHDQTGDDRELTVDHEALTWYFEQRIGAPPPDDLEAFAKARGFRGADDFKRAVRRDYRCRSIDDEASSDA